jgi:hypothetical protein
MLKLYYAPGTSSLAPHVLLEEAGAAYEAQPIQFLKFEQQSEAYLKINPRGKVPALQLEGAQVLTENGAILSYVAKKFPGAKLWPGDLMTEVQAISAMAWFSTTVHPASMHFVRPERFTVDAIDGLFGYSEDLADFPVRLPSLHQRRHSTSCAVSGVTCWSCRSESSRYFSQYCTLSIEVGHPVRRSLLPLTETKAY